jgi:glycosyltransferase involved in cell wall biosynthesis
MGFEPALAFRTIADTAVSSGFPSGVSGFAGSSGMRVLVATDAWKPQINGVSRTVELLCANAAEFGAEIIVLGPDRFRTWPLPTYRSIRLAFATPSTVSAAIREARPDAIHIATEGPIGFMTRRHCLHEGRSFTTCYHTRFPEYLRSRIPVPTAWSYAALRAFHNRAHWTLVSTPTLQEELRARGFSRTRLWTRGIDTRLFENAAPVDLHLPRPMFLNVGRIAVEKNIEAFLSLDLPGSKVVVGDGPDLVTLRARYPHCHFLGAMAQEQLAGIYAAADVLVFPSRTDTLGLVMLEALAAGTPVAALPTPGPQDVLGASDCGVMDTDLRSAALRALEIDRDRCRRYGASFQIAASVRNFLSIVSDVTL